MKVLLCHNHYQQRGGEDGCFEVEAALLERHGHRVVRYTLHNDAIDGMTRLRVAGRTLWSRESHRALRDLMRRERPDVMHCTNTFPLISPSAYYAAHAEGVPVVQSLHNYRIACAGGTLMRDGKVCEACLGRTFGWSAVRHGCYRGSRLGSATVAGMNAAHRIAGTWSRRVDRYIALTRFARDKSIEAGLPANRISVKPNFLETDPGTGTGRGGFALFVGRLSTEKGVDTLLRSWEMLRAPLMLKVAGEGPLMEQVRAASTSDPRIMALGWQSPSQVRELMGEATCLIVPSLWYEGLPRTIVEAYARGTPVIASRLGSLAELVSDGVTGRLIEPGNAADLTATVEEIGSGGDQTATMREAARRTYLDQFTADRNLDLMMNIYRQAIISRTSHSSHRSAPPEAAGVPYG